MMMKGAVAIRLNLFDTSLVFVCAHLAAGQSNYVRNIHGVHHIVVFFSLSRVSFLSSIIECNQQEERNDNWRDATNGIVFRYFSIKNNSRANKYSSQNQNSPFV